MTEEKTRDNFDQLIDIPTARDLYGPPVVDYGDEVEVWELKRYSCYGFHKEYSTTCIVDELPWMPDESEPYWEMLVGLEDGRIETAWWDDHDNKWRFV